MRLLAISPNYPFPADKGDRIRTNAILSVFKELGYEIDLFCLDPRKEIFKNNFRQQKIYHLSKFVILTNLLKHFICRKSFTSAFCSQKQLIRDLEENFQHNKYDLILVFSSGFDFLIPVLNKYQRKVFWDLIDFDSLKWQSFASNSNLIKSWIYSRESNCIEEAERKILNFAKIVSLISLREIDRFSLSLEELKKTIVLPQAVALKDNLIASKLERLIIFTGQMDYWPNIEAVKFFDSQVMPLLKNKYPDLIFKVAGRNPPPKLISLLKNTTFTGEVKDINAIIAESSVAVVPLLSVFGLPNKALEAMALGTPVVATSQVAIALQVTSGKELLVADTPEEFCSQIEKLLDDSVTAREIAKEAKDYIKTKCNLNNISKELQFKLEAFSN